MELKIHLTTGNFSTTVLNYAFKESWKSTQ